MPVKHRVLMSSRNQTRILMSPEPDALLEQIKADLNSGKCRRYFITIVCNHVGQTIKPMPVDAVPIAGLFKQEEEATRTYSIPGSRHSQAHDIAVRPSPSTTGAMQANVSMRTPSPASTLPSAYSSTTDSTADHPERLYQLKKRYYLVFVEVVQALRDVPTLPIVFQVLSDVLVSLLPDFIVRPCAHYPTTTLTFLFIEYRVHRDAGNIIVITKEDKVTGKLSDLEYAKEFGSNSISSDTNAVGDTVTMNF